MIEALYAIQGEENSGWITPSADPRCCAARSGANAKKILATQLEGDASTS